MELDNAMAEELKKEVVLMPVTPAKPIPPRPELNSINRGVSSNFLGKSNLDTNLHVGIDSGSILSVHANNGFNDLEASDKGTESLSNLDTNLHVGIDSSAILSFYANNGFNDLEASDKGIESLGRTDVSQSVLSDMGFGVSSGVCLEQCSGSSSGEACNAAGVISSFGSTGSGNLSTSGVNLTELLASHDDSSLPFFGESRRETSDGIQDSSGGLRLYQDNSKVEAPHVGVEDSKFFDGNSLHGFGLSSATPSTPAEKPSPRKRGNNGVDMNKKPQKRPKMKRHRPKILDESKPRKIPKSKTATNSASNPDVPRTVSREKRKHVKRSNLKASVNFLEEVEGQAVKKTNTNLKTEDEGKLRKSPILEIGEPSPLNPWTPEPSTPKQAISMESPCERREHVTKDKPESLVNLLENDEGQEISDNSELAAKSCRRALNFSMEDQTQNDIHYQYQSQNKSEEQSPFERDYSLNFQEQDFDLCAELKKIVNQYRRRKRSLGKSQRKPSVNSNSKTKDLNSRTGMKNKSDVDSSPLPNKVKEMMAGLANGGEVTTYQDPGATNQIDGRYNSLKVYQRIFRCLKNSRKLGPNFPKLCKKKRSKRIRIGNCARLWNETAGFSQKRRKSSLRHSTDSEIDSCSSLIRSRQVGRILRPRKPTRAAMSNMKSSKCIQPLHPTARSRRKRPISSAPTHNLAVKLSKSHGEQEKDSTIIHQELYNTTLPFSCVVTKKKRSKLFIQRHSSQLQSTSAPQASNVRSQGTNDHESEACGDFRDVNNQNLLRNVGSYADLLVIEHKKSKKDPLESKDKLLQLHPQENQDVMLNNMRDPVQQEDVTSNNNIEACSSEHNGVLQISSLQDIMLKILKDPVQQENVTSSGDIETCSNARNDILQIPSSEDVMLKILYDPVQQENVTSNNNIEARSPEMNDVLQTFSSEDASTKALIDYIIQEPGPLPINKCTQLVVQDQDGPGALLPYEGKIEPSKKKKPQSKVDIDPETMRMWKLLMENLESKVTGEVDNEKEKWWEEQRKIFRGRVDSLLALMHLIQGNRRFSPWKGSVLDSVIGAFLTQNVSDHLSSSAYMSLRARYPPKDTSNHGDGDKESTCINGSDKSSTGVDRQANDTKDEHSHVFQPKQNIDIQCAESIEEIIAYAAASGLVEDEIGDNASQRHDFACSSDSDAAAHAFSLLERPDAFRQTLQSEEHNFLQKFYGHQKGEVPCDFEKRESLDSSSSGVTFPKKHHDSSINYQEKIPQPERKSRKKRGKIEEKQQATIDWDQLRKTYSFSRSRDSTSITLDSVDWEAVRQATVEEVAATIAVRGQQRIIATRIKELLDRLVKDHGSIDLEWLRDVPPDKAKEYLLSIKGLGLKSVECIRLLALHHIAFPVDTNVGRVAVRLGWVPLQPLPEDVQIHLLNQYPMMDSIQKYLWPRLCTLDQRTLYELHYQLITFGKVFCTKKEPNCNACPMRGECRHFASAFASARLRLPGPQQKSIVMSKAPIAADREPTVPITPTILSLPNSNNQESGYRTSECEPTVEFPKSPEPEPTEIPVRDIEDFYYDSGDEIPVIKLNAEEFKENFLHFVDKTESFLQQGDVSQALVALSLEAASMPMPKLKDVNRLRTEHQVYELPDSHPLLARLDKREPDDPCPYLLAISTTGESSNSSEQLREPWNKPQESDLHDLPTCFPNDCNQGQDHQTVRGTILVPCRTAQNGSFPLNGTYFQVNEVFADHESSQCQINVPRAWLWNLPRRTLYCGTSASSIFKGLSIEEIQRCFWKGFICVRGFDRKTGDPKPLSERFHVSTTMAGKKKQAQNE